MQNSTVVSVTSSFIALLISKLFFIHFTLNVFLFLGIYLSVQHYKKPSKNAMHSDLHKI